jgi:hypothetical protein
MTSEEEIESALAERESVEPELAKAASSTVYANLQRQRNFDECIRCRHLESISKLFFDPLFSIA